MSNHKKIRDLPIPCSHPEHNPPSMRVFEPGVYEHTCPKCGAKKTFTVPRPTLKTSMFGSYLPSHFKSRRYG